MSHAKRPSFQWYPGDAQRDTALRACCLEARGLWREMMDLMHDGEPYGHLTAGGAQIDGVNLARMVGLTSRRCLALLSELDQHKVFSRTADGVIYSRRMVRDEHNRNVRAAGGKLGGNPALMVHAEDNLPSTLGASSDQPLLLQSASASSPLVKKAKRNGHNNAKGEASLLLLQIRRLAGSPPRGVPFDAIDALGPGVLTAYQAVGGWDRVVTVAAKDHSFLNNEFAAALEAARA